MSGKDHSASVRQRLLDRSRRDGEDFQRLLVRFCIERLLYRLSQSPHASEFILKGATLFTVWMGSPHRATKDLDLLSRGKPDAPRFVSAFRDVSRVPCPRDGVSFDGQGIVSSPIREGAIDSGVRLAIPCSLAGARLKIQVDIGTGDTVIPPPEEIEIRSILDLPNPVLKCYSKETVVAEKLEALVVLGITTSRMKDIYDLDALRKQFHFDETLAEAIAATFARRHTAIPASLPIGLSDDFAEDSTKRTQWQAFLKKSGASGDVELRTVIAELRSWLWPILRRIFQDGYRNSSEK